MMIFAFLAAWVFGREFADHTMKEMLATPTPRAAIASAKFVLIAGWILGLVLLAFLAWLAIGAAVRIPGWAPELAQATLGTLLLTSLLNFMLLPWVAFFAGAGRGYLPAIGWALATLVLAQIAGVLGWGEWFPWAVPALAAGMGGQGPGQIPLHSYAVVAIAFIAGLAATLAWWRGADQPR
jgi:ABC-2 type transport system permease protein